MSAEEAKHTINDYIQSLPDDEFKDRSNQHKKTLSKMFSAINDMFTSEDHVGAKADFDKTYVRRLKALWTVLQRMTG